MSRLWLLVAASAASMAPGAMSALAGVANRAEVDTLAAAGAAPLKGPGRAMAAALPDTILRPDLDRPAPAVTSGLAASADEPHVQLGLRRIPIAPSGELVRPPAAFGPPPGVAARPSVVPPADDPLALDPLLAELLRWRVADLGTAGGDSALFLPPPPEPPPPTALPAGEGPGRFVTDYADLAVRVRSRMEVGGDWTRFQPCHVQFQQSCNPTLIPQLSPDFLFGVQLDGTIADRIRVDVDFDQAREFGSANRINIFYEGREDDILQRLEVGDVQFQLPRSRFLTEGMPAGNFGFQAEGQFGPVDFQTVWAQQRGDLNSRVFRLSGLGDQRAFVQEDTLVYDDADYVRGQFFFLVDPTLIDDYPHVDALELDPASAPIDVVPGQEPIQLYRFEADAALRQQVEGYIQADATASAGGETITESGWFRYLQPGLDYFVHPSGLWVALRTPLRSEEMLAVTFITAAGDTVGDYNPERIHNQGGRPQLRLLKASGASHRPGLPTWEQEMHQVYRVSGSPDVEPGSVELSISLGPLSAGRTFKRRPTGEDITFLRLFGLDEEAPADVLDPAFVYSPGGELFQAEPAVQGTFVLFPTLHPFAEPPPLPSLGLTEVETADILADDANPSIYDEEDPFERDNSGRFRLSLGYRIRSEGLISSFSLGAFGIQEGSERIELGDRLLTRGLDYEIDYDVGQVRLLEPDLLFQVSPDAAIRATWEQRSLFQVSPTQIFGLRTHTDLGGRGGLDLLGLYQSERSVVTRPLLGTEPAAALLGGLTANYDTPVPMVDRLLDVLPGLRLDGETALHVDGELAFSLPNPNTNGRAFVDDFDAAAQSPISLLAESWMLGSAPASALGAETVLPAAVGTTTAAPLVWQNRWIVASSSGDSLGIHEGLFPRVDIDQQIRVVGAEVREPGMLVSLGSAPGAPVAWRSLTTSLSTTGLDLTRTEFLELYVAGSEAVSLVLDLGSVSEDAFFIDDEGSLAGTRAEDGEAWGSAILDQEADPALGEIWNDAADQLGVWDESCLAERGRIYRIGDPRAVCTRGNGRPDSEDLDEDGNLDVLERHLRYVVRLDGSSPYLARTSQETGTDFQLYRIPIRDATVTEVGGAISDADLRAVRHLRITVAGPPNERVQLARMRLVGSRWIKREGDGVLLGIAGDTLDAFGRMEVSSVSRVTEGLAYTSPPGVLEELADPTTAYGGQGIEFNEKSIGIAFQDVPSGGRAEVYHRFPQRPRNFLAYREARLWVVAREGDFGADRPHYFFLKVGSDPENFYLYRTPLSPPAGGDVAQADWLPEVVVDFDPWFELRRRAEELLLSGPRAPGEPPVAVWSADSTYAVVLRDRGRAPNLAAVREMSLGVWNEGPAPLSGEIWIDELRLGNAVRDPGVAGSVDMTLDGAGVLTSRLSFTNRGAFFRQLRSEPTYQTDRNVSFGSTLALDRWMPSDWGLEMPLSLQLDRTSQAPLFLTGSDLRADRLRALRPTESRQTRVGIALRKRTRSANPWLGFVLDGLNARAAYTKASGSTVTTRSSSRGLDAGVGWTRLPESRDIAVVPGFVEGLVRALLPGFLEDKVVDTRLRLTPERVSLGSSYQRQDSRIFRYERIVTAPEDSLAVATLAPRESLETVADVRLRPIGPLTADVALLTVRDLLPAREAIADPRVQALIADERWQAQGVDLGWETNRLLRTRLSYRPQIFTWLRNDFDWSTVYRSDRTANLVELLPTPAGDTSLVLTRNATGQRDWSLALGLDPGRLLASWLGPLPPAPAEVAPLRAMVAALRPLTATYQEGVSSRFNRDPVEPGLFDYQLGLGGTSAFHTMDGDTAALVTDRSSWTLGAGVGLPGGGLFQVAYGTTDISSLDRRSDRTIFQKNWPDVRLRLPSVALPTFTGIERLDVVSGFTRSTRDIEFGGRAQQRRFDEDVQVPLDISVTWLSAVVTSYQGAFRSGRGRDPTGDTEREESSHRLSLTSSFVLPGVTGLDRPVQLTLLGGYTSETRCRTPTGSVGCVAFLDQVRRTISLSLDTSAGGLEFGVQLSFDDRQSFVGQQTGSTQLQLGLFGQLDFSAGMLPLG